MVDKHAIASFFNSTVDALREITLEIPGARSINEVVDIFLRPSRKLYVGAMLVALAFFLLFMTGG